MKQIGLTLAWGFAVAAIVCADARAEDSLERTAEHPVEWFTNLSAEYRAVEQFPKPTDPPRRNPNDPAVGAPPAADTLVFEPLIVRDPQVHNQEALRMLMPSGWQAEGGIVWMHDRSNVATSPIVVWNPDGSEGLQLYPIISYAWSDPPIDGFGPDSNYLGNIMVQPMDPLAYVANVLMPNFRGRVSNARLVDRRALPDLAATVQRQVAEQTMRKEVRAERIRVSYEINGKAYDEDFYVAIVYARGDLAPNMVWWNCEVLHSFRAARGELDAKAPLMQVMVSSLRLDPKWLTVYLSVKDQWAQNMRQQIAEAGRLARLVNKTYDEIRQINRQAWENQQRISDERHRQFINVIRGVTVYTNPTTGQSVALPNQFQHAWVSSTGQYMVTNNPNHNPNQSGTGTWQQLSVQQPGG